MPKLDALQQEIAQGDAANDEHIASLVEEIADLVPSAVDALVGLFAPAALGKLAGGATNYVLKRIRRRQDIGRQLRIHLMTELHDRTKQVMPRSTGMQPIYAHVSGTKGD